MTRRRFVNRHGWEKWIDVPDPPPYAMKILDPFEVPSRPCADPPELAERLRERLFVLQSWHHPQWPREHVYSEEGFALDEERFADTSPSLHRERELVRTIRAIEDLTNYGRAKHPLTGMLAAENALRQINEILEEWRALHTPFPRTNAARNK